MINTRKTIYHKTLLQGEERLTQRESEKRDTVSKGERLSEREGEERKLQERKRIETYRQRNLNSSLHELNKE